MSSTAAARGERTPRHHRPREEARFEGWRSHRVGRRSRRARRSIVLGTAVAIDRVGLPYSQDWIFVWIVGLMVALLGRRGPALAAAPRRGTGCRSSARCSRMTCCGGSPTASCCRSTGSRRWTADQLLGLGQVPTIRLQDALYTPGPPASLGLRGVQLLVLALLRDAAGGGRDLALPLPVVPPLRRLRRGLLAAMGAGHLRAVPWPPRRGSRRIMGRHRPHLPGSTMPCRGEQPARAQGRRALPEGNGLGERRRRGALAPRRLHDADLPLPVAATSTAAGGRCSPPTRSAWVCR